MSAALLLESLLIGGLVFAVSQPKVIPHIESVPLMIEPLPDAPTPELPAPPRPPLPSVSPVTPQVVRQVQPVTQHVQQQTPTPATPVVQAAPVEPAPQAVPQAFSTPPAPAPVAQAPAPVAQDLAPAYNAKLAAAVQAAFEVPAPAHALNFKGRARVEFTLQDGVASAIRIVQGSGLGAVDRAAIKAVQAAAFPQSPAGLQTQGNSYQIWVACF
ncbi:TonB family protein [Paucibacter sp. DJ1R-11]|uniref:TonB family protein n=1 Tax=Paucibacter sp. DJ1R-11 TaxID=2893556 RepID=UPI0021E3625A|nr:TonB family protein [Paucibacter sp. DJ1R-11]